ncbi:MAG: Mrp/NBP35 family ATP-binding protein [Pseudomonadota bacterium]
MARQDTSIGMYEELIQDALSDVVDPLSGKPISDTGFLSTPKGADGRFFLTLSVPVEHKDLYAEVRQEVERRVKAVEGVTAAFVVLTSDAPPASAPNPQASPARPGASAQKTRSPRLGGIDFTGIGAMVAVASGKGGVGKSTVTTNLAVALAKMGLAVGVLDADIYGPSIPTLFGVKESPAFKGKTKASPPVAHGAKLMSMGFLIAEGTPMVWRAPMVVSALKQLMSDVIWAPLDILLIDMPPGTGDTQLTISQQVPLDGAVIVSTPQDLALIDARKGVAMFQKVAVPILGIVENMSSFRCPKCGEVSAIFGHGGARDDAEKLGVPFLGEIPLHMEIRSASDAGKPVALFGESALQNAFSELAHGVWNDVAERRLGGRKPPAIVIEDDL